MYAKRVASAIIKSICVFALLGMPAASFYVEQALAMQIEVPLPAPNPMRSSLQAPDTPSSPDHPRVAEISDWSEAEVNLALEQCRMMLAGTGAVYKRLKPIREGRCGVPAPVELSEIGTIISVKIDPPARVTCGLAATLGAWLDSFVQPLASKHLGVRITSIRNAASYVCRNRYGAADKRLSEHALANALDMAAFQTSEGVWVTVLDSWALPPQEQLSGVTPTLELPPAQTTETDPSGQDAGAKNISPEAAFLNDIHDGGCTLFGTVLGPNTNEAHKDHYHYDMAARKNGNYCE